MSLPRTTMRPSGAGRISRAGHRCRPPAATRPRSPRTTLFAGLILALTAALASSHAGASAEDRSDPVSVTLHPGWNMAGWVGAAAPVSRLFEQVPALESAATWDAQGRRYQWARQGGAQPGELRRLTAGMGLWLRLGGSEAVAWAQQPTDGAVLVHLRPGRNLVAWTGREPESVRSLAKRLAPAFVRASMWDAAERRQLGYSIRAPSPVTSIRALQAGDALWVEVTDDRYWWQSGAALTTWEFPASVTDAQRTRVRAGVADVIRFFAERYGIAPPEFTVAVDPDADVFAGVRGRTILLSEAALSYALLDVTLAHEYFHILQARLMKGASAGARASPIWMTEGSATYAGALYERASRRMTADAMTRSWLDVVADAAVTLRELEQGALSDAEYAVAYELGALAAQWLTGHAAAIQAGVRHDHLPGDWGSADTADAYIRYYRALGTADDWGAAFEHVFGITVSAFYERFESYLGEAIPLARVGVSAADGSGTTRPALHGVVLDASGSPLPGVLVVVRNEGRTVSGTFYSAPGRILRFTDDDGVFTLQTPLSSLSSWDLRMPSGCRLGGDQLDVRSVASRGIVVRVVDASPCVRE